MGKKSLLLIDQIAKVKYLHRAWLKLDKSNLNSRGLSNISIKEFEKNLSRNLKKISEQLRNKTYTFSQVKAVTIPKNNGGLRPLRVSEIKDRIVHKAIALKLDDLLAKQFHLDNICSFAYRKGKNVEDAIRAMRNYYEEGYRYILEADIEKFFDTVDKEALIQNINSRLPDSSLKTLIEQALQQEIGNPQNFSSEIFEEYFQNTENGIPQGNALSPLLANIYLSPFDARMISEKYRMIRYADDFIILCKTKQEAEKAYEIAIEELEEKLKLTVHKLGAPNDISAKTRIVDPVFNKFSFLSIRFDGKKCWVIDKKFDSLKEKIIGITTVGSNSGLLPMLTSLKNTVEGWIAAYHFVDLEDQAKEIDKYIDRQLYILFTDLDFTLQRKSVTKLKYKGKKREIIALSPSQRRNSGIPYAVEIWKRLNAVEETIKAIEDASNQTPQKKRAITLPSNEGNKHTVQSITNQN